MHINERIDLFPLLSGFFTKFLPITFWILLIYGFDEPYLAGLTILSAAVHEGGHLLIIWLFGGGGSLSGALSGMRIRRSLRRTYISEIAILFAGPCANLAFCALGFTLMPLWGDYAVSLVAVNLFTALSNLLPVRGHDGYAILRFIIEWKESGRWAYTLLDAVSFALTALFSLTALYLMERFDSGYWLWVLFTAALLSEMGIGARDTKVGI